MQRRALLGFAVDWTRRRLAQVDFFEVTVDDPDTPERRLDGALLAKLGPDLVLTDGSEEHAVVDYAEISDAVGGMTARA